MKVGVGRRARPLESFAEDLNDPPTTLGIKYVIFWHPSPLQ
jgi:hypothetical protein